MSRKLKLLFAAALALTAFGAIAAGAQAAEEFHCSAEPCRWKAITDGTGTTAHQVFVVENEKRTESLTFTCEYFRAVVRSNTKNTTEFVISWPTTESPNDREAFNGCKINGSSGVVIHMNSCNLILKAAGGKAGSAKGGLSCAVGSKVEVTMPTGCTFTLGPQELPGIGYHTIGTSPNREITATASAANIVITADGSAATCFINPAQTLIGTYTTGNTIVTAETDPGEAMADGWFE